MKITSEFANNFYTHFEKELCRDTISKRLERCLNNHYLNEAAVLCYTVNEDGRLEQTEAYKYLLRFMLDKDYAVVHVGCSKRMLCGHKAQKLLKGKLKGCNVLELALTEDNAAFVAFRQFMKFSRHAYIMGCTYEEYRQWLTHSIGNGDLFDFSW